jgi:hypothetical protein
MGVKSTSSETPPIVFESTQFATSFPLGAQAVKRTLQVIRKEQNREVTNSEV